MRLVGWNGGPGGKVDQSKSVTTQSVLLVHASFIVRTRGEHKTAVRTLLHVHTVVVKMPSHWNEKPVFSTMEQRECGSNALLKIK